MKGFFSVKGERDNSVCEFEMCVKWGNLYTFGHDHFLLSNVIYNSSLVEFQGLS